MSAYEHFGAGRIKSAEETVESRKQVRGYWHMCDAAEDTPVARYLSRRGLPWLARHEHIRFRAAAYHKQTDKYLPAMVALIISAEGDIAAVHRTYLTADGTKADVDPVKSTKGSYSGGAIRLHQACTELLVAEGIETAASAAMLLDVPAWAAIAAGNLRERMVLPPIVRSVVIAADHDRAGRAAAAGAARRWRAEGRSVRIVQPDRYGEDFNDVLRRRGAFSHAA